MSDSTAIAIVGMAGRFPGARNIGELWQNLKSGVESIRPFTDGELLAAGVAPEELARPEYVKSGTVLPDMDMFDAAFFGFSPRDAAIMDPQHRVFLECAWEALENAGHVPESFVGSIAVYAGSGMNSYMIHNLLTNRDLMESAGLFLIRQTGNDKDVLATRVSYELNLHGPSINVQTACSTSLVAVHLACESLLNQECDLALAGGVTIEFPHGRGYLYREGEIQSRDGHCRAFDADSSGTVFSSGAGIVVLRRLDDALADGDTIHAVILGSAINNDGARKAGYLAPSVDGQAEVVAEALRVAGIEPHDVSYVETHGTGTRVGDPIEIKALTQAFQLGGGNPGSCAIGSLKTNIGHLDTAAGVAGLIKTVLALEHRQIPPSLHFRTPNPLIDFANGPFYVNTALQEWKPGPGPRRAGVTSLGIGGTNAHVVLEEAPSPSAAPDGNAGASPQLLVISAKTAAALEQAGRNLGTYLADTPELDLRDVAHTCQVGRKAFAHRRAFVAATIEEAARLARGTGPGVGAAGSAAIAVPKVVFMFSGQGSQYVDMGRELYETDAVFRSQLDLCAEGLVSPLDRDLRAVLYPPEAQGAAAAEALSRTCFTQPALFSIEYALAQWWIRHGVTPDVMIGHSIGEYVAACLAGVFSLEDGLRVSAMRGRLMDELPRGSMLAVSASPEKIPLPGDLSLAAVNGPEQCVISGPTDSIQKLTQELERRSTPARLLRTSHAFHSAMMDPILERFTAEMKSVSLHPPTIPYVSNVTGTWITAAEATDPRYWARHLRSTVQFSGGLEELFRDQSRVFLEVGPGHVLASLARQNPGKPKGTRVFSSTRHPQEQASDRAFLLAALGNLWCAGSSIDWASLHAGETPRRIPLPTYPFERRRFWVEPGESLVSGAARAPAPAAKAPEIDPWFHQRVWKQSRLEKSASSAPVRWLVFRDETGLGAEISGQLKAAGHDVLEVMDGAAYERTGPGKYVVRAGEKSDYDQLLSDVSRNEHMPAAILHLWSVQPANAHPSLDQTLDRSFYSLLFLAQALAGQDVEAAEITCVSNGLQSISGEDVVAPARAALFGPVRVIPKEFPGLVCRSIDVDWNVPDLRTAAQEIIEECSVPVADACVALRHSQRWVESFEPLSLERQPSRARLKEKGVYWITGGLGGIGLLIAEYLARTVHARLVLSGRTAPSSAHQLSKVKELESLGSEVLTIAADVTDRRQMEETLATIRKRFGEPNGVIHAAGMIEDAPLQIKTRESAARVLAPKIQGTLILQDALRGSTLDFWLLFSSISSLTPPPGQIDYAAANAFLDAFACSRPGQPTTAVNWSLWADVGMGGRDATGRHAILGRRLFQSEAESVYSLTLSCEKDWLVGEHRFKSGEALVPGTGYLQLAAAALVRDRFTALEFEDVFFLAPLSVGSAEAREVRVRMRHQRSGSRFSILSRDGDWIEYATGQVARSQRPPLPPQKVEEIRSRCSRRRIDFDDRRRTRQERSFDFGPRWRNLRALHVGEREALAELRLAPEFSADVQTWFLHPALLDLATGASLYLITGYEDSDALYLPLSYKRITVYHPLPERFFSHIRSREENTAQREIATFNLTLLDVDGQVLAEIAEFSLRRISTTDDDRVPALRSRPASRGEPVDVPGGWALSSADGIRAFDKILSSVVPKGVVVARGRFDTKPAGLTAAVSSTRGSARPGSGPEATLAEWWKELLGVEAVGLDDDFFDLGGHSLVALRLFNRINKTFQLDLGLSRLFEARTVRQLAALITQEATSEAVEEDTSRSVVAIRRHGPRLPLFLISGLGGEVLGFHNLARCLGEDQPVFGLQPQGLDGKKPFLTRVEDMAVHYIREIRAVQPHGPYCLAGYSFGGYIVFEMAQQLVASGETVALLGLLDTIEWQYLEQVRHSVSLRQRWALRLDRMMKGRWEYIRKIVATRATGLMYRFFESVSRPVPQRLSTLQDINRFAMSLYRPAVYPGRLTIFRSVTRSVTSENDELLGWGGLASGGIEVHDISGSHNDILNEPNVRVLAERLQACLDRAQLSPPVRPPDALREPSILGK